MQSTFKYNREIAAIRLWLLFFMISLVLSGLTTIPLEQELSFVSGLFGINSSMGNWIDRVYEAIHVTGDKYHFLLYGYDWLAFAHFVLALVFIGPYRDPVRNKWVVEFGIYACLLIIPFALLAGHYRGIPFWWRLIDCSFGAIGLIPLMLVYKKIVTIETIINEEQKSQQQHQ
jgi:hypothetical protein